MTHVTPFHVTAEPMKGMSPHMDDEPMRPVTAPGHSVPQSHPDRLEAEMRITKAENGGLGGEGIWSPETLGYRPTYESDAMKKFILGGFVTRSFMAKVTSPLVVPITKITSPM